MADGSLNSFPIPITLTENPEDKADKTTTINGLDLSENRVLKSGQFAESITGEKMLAALKYIAGNFTNGLKLDDNLMLDAVSIGGYKKTLTSSDDLDTMYTRAQSGMYYCASSVQNCPANYCLMLMVATGSDSNSVVMQVVFSSQYIYTRLRSGSGTNFHWNDWKKVALAEDGAIDISSLFIWNSNLSFTTNNLVAFYHPVSKTVSGNIVFETSEALTAGTTYVTIPSAYRPSDNTPCGCMYRNTNTGKYEFGTVYFRSNGNVNQSITNYFKGCSASFEYKVG